jgi:hypothetical protein
MIRLLIGGRSFGKRQSRTEDLTPQILDCGSTGYWVRSKVHGQRRASRRTIIAHTDAPFVYTPFRTSKKGACYAFSASALGLRSLSAAP